jgi:uncharacterized protein YbbC (DUF1343 family)
MVGADVFISNELHLIKGKKVGIVTNHTATLSNGVHLVDTLFKIKDIKIVTLFGPEHGIRGLSGAGDKIENSVDDKTGITVISLYGKINKPIPEMLKEIDVLIFDIQDVGARFYTYISTLFYSIQAAAENKIPIIVLDRPNPISGLYVNGPIRKEELKSFVGIAPIPIAHGLTIGELAKLFAEEKYIGDSLKPNLTIIKMKNWKRDLFYDQCGLRWINPSPNIQNLEAAIIYPGTCLIEGVNISEGRGSDSPFLKIGAPYINAKELKAEMDKYSHDGLEIDTTSFIPIDIPSVVTNPKFKDKKCFGLHFKITNRKKFDAVRFGVILVSTLHKLYSDFEFREKGFDRLAGDSNLRRQILENKNPLEIINGWQTELNKFLEVRKKHLLYN